MKKSVPYHESFSRLSIQASLVCIRLVENVGLLLILLFCHTFVIAQSVDEEAVLQTISQSIAKVQTLKCNFIQTKYVKLLDDKMESKGQMSYQQRDKLRWEYTTPYTYLFLMNGSQIQFLSRDRNDKIDAKKNMLFKEIGDIIIKSIVGDCINDKKNFSATVSVSSDGYRVALTPQRKNMRQLFRVIILTFDKSQLLVGQIELEENNGDRTVITFNNIHVNENIPESEFQIR